MVHASSLAEAEALYRSDLGLPDGNGLDLIKRLQTIHPSPSIVLSGYDEAEARASSLGAGSAGASHEAGEVDPAGSRARAGDAMSWSGAAATL